MPHPARNPHQKFHESPPKISALQLPRDPRGPQLLLAVDSAFFALPQFQIPNDWSFLETQDFLFLQLSCVRGRDRDYAAPSWAPAPGIRRNSSRNFVFAAAA
jgi:hypothetical protein